MNRTPPMNVAKHLVLSGAIFVFAARGLPAPDNQWFATWKLNRALSHFTGPVITIARTRNGYHFDFGATSFDIGDDGRDYPTVATRSTSLRAVGKGEWFRVHKVNGKEVDHSTLRITPDGRTLLIHTVATDTDGKTHRSEDMEVRVGSGNGLSGTWRSTVAGINVSETIALEDAGGGKMRWRFPKEGQFYVALPNGAPAAYEGPRSVPGVTVRLRSVSAREMRWTEFINGKAYTEGVDRLSGNGKVLRETSWQVMRPADKQEAVYERE